MALEAGEQLGPYEIVGALGAGGMGEVYRARDSRLHREVAIKVGPADLPHDLEMRRRLEREARAASALNHPHICTVYDVGEDRGRYFIAMELIEGRTLGNAIAGRPLPLEQVLYLGIQIADALDTAHKGNIVHRDLKPSNVFVTLRGDAKLLDFGLAKRFVDTQSLQSMAATVSGMLTVRGEVLGTVAYMSPEQAQGKEVDARSDIFSFGAVLYEMSTGRHAFDGDSAASIYAAILREQPPPAATVNPLVPDELQRIIDKTLEKDLSERYQSAHELMIDLKRLKRAMFESSGTGSRVQVASAPRRRKRFVLSAGMASIGLVLAAILITGEASRPATGLLDSVQITYSQDWKDGPLLTDGTRLYFQGRNGPVEMSINGGTIAPLRGSTQGMRMLDVSRDGSQLLIMKPNLGDEGLNRGSIWSVPVLGGIPKRIGNLTVTDARWLPDGRSVLFLHLNSVSLTGPDGADPKKIWEAPGRVLAPVLSPDGRRIRLTIIDGRHARLWELNIDGTNAHPLPLEWPADSSEHDGQWTPDDRHFFFLADAGGSSSAFELIEPAWFEFWKRPAAVKLVSSDIQVLDAVPSRDSKQVFMLGRVPQGAMQVFDSQQKRFVPFLGGLAAIEFVISPDRQWMVYTDYPRHYLWRSRLDGSEKLQLTNSFAAWPRWSPDGKNIAYMDWRSIYLISSDGGTPEKLIGGGEAAEVAPEWTPDGKAIIFNDFPGVGTEFKGIQRIDLATKAVSVTPGSKGFYVGSWSPDGKHMVAIAQDPLRIMLYDVQAQVWTELKRLETHWGFWVWTRDSKAILLAQNKGDKGIYRLTIENGKWERVASLDGITTSDQVQVLSLTADGQPAIMADTSVVQIYSMKWN